MIKKVRRDIKVIAGDLQTALQHEAANIVDIGNLLLEAKEQLAHGRWLPWLKKNFGSSDSTAQNYMNAARFIIKYPTVGYLNLRPTALYFLGAHLDSIPTDEVNAILKASETEPVDQERAVEIINSIHAERAQLFGDGDEESAIEEQHRSAFAQAQERAIAALERAEAERSEIDDILDGPPPELPPPPSPAPVDFALASFDEAIKILMRLQAKPLSSFVATTHSPKEIRAVADFLQAVADDVLSKNEHAQ